MRSKCRPKDLLCVSRLVSLQVSFEIRYSSSLTLQLRLVPQISSTSQKRAIKTASVTFFGSLFDLFTFGRDVLLVQNLIIFDGEGRRRRTHGRTHSDTPFLETLPHNRPFGQLHVLEYMNCIPLMVVK